MKLLTILILLTSCGRVKPKDYVITPKSNKKFTISNEIFIPYYNTYEKETNVNPFHVTINFSNLNDNIAGVCYSWNNGDKEILIDIEYWNSYDELQREILIFHELGHCILNRKHKTDNYKGYALSIMNPYVIYRDNYELYRNEYIIELLTHDHTDLIKSIDQ